MVMVASKLTFLDFSAHELSLSKKPMYTRESKMFPYLFHTDLELKTFKGKKLISVVVSVIVVVVVACAVTGMGEQSSNNEIKYKIQL
ncbi:Hypothetical predicted protein [Octopus vulgaris]|uniref:Uncharacterized protein n=1 Tax=Octopus vulgaris TaxID=6645 RepID=A0AA36FJG8_OCTVU|nr:Hypothetical predicted protein [Octopus vulgaris]